MEIQNTQTTNAVNNAQANNQPVNNAGSPTNNRFLLVVLGALLLVVILFVIIISGVFKGSNQQGTVGQQTVLPRVVTPNAPQTQQDISQQPITSQQDTLKALQQIDSTNPDTLGADLDLNTADASSFSQ